ncbi:MAG: wax ester/triacylglycerol synthase family O-acyltransferase [Pseudomonadales bacterium]|nr:wax ester/triacylglycerol synthase family O-acyltransferase [Pseudomonadales bacterium]
MERLSGLDASFLYGETSTMLMHVAFIAICDTSENPNGYSFRDIYDLIDVKTQEESAFRRRLVEVPFGLHHPLWVDDPDFQVTDHVQQYTLPKDSGMEQLAIKLGRIMSHPLDRSRPLWEAWIIEGLAKNRYAFVLKIHHAMVDGVSGTELFRNLFTTHSAYQIPRVFNRSQGEKIPTSTELMAHALRSKIKTPQRVYHLMSETFKGVSALVKGGNVPQNESGQHAKRARPLSAPRTHFNHRLSVGRSLALVDVSLSDIKAIKNATNTTVNDVVLAICGGALREYLIAKNDLPEKTLIAMVPISVRKQSKEKLTNNQVSGMWSTLATDIDDPLARLKLINEDTKDAKQEHDAVGADLLQDWAEVNTPGAFNLAMRFYASTLVDVVNPVHNTIISNVPGPRESLYLAGSKVESIRPIGPVMEGVGLNISLASYQDRIGITLHADRLLVGDVNEIGVQIRPAFERLKNLTQVAEKAIYRTPECTLVNGEDKHPPFKISALA